MHVCVFVCACVCACAQAKASWTYISFMSARAACVVFDSKPGSLEQQGEMTRTLQQDLFQLCFTCLAMCFQVFHNGPAFKEH